MVVMSPQPFGRYLLVEPLGEGGMAQVYRAVLRDSGFEKQVALKRVHRELCADPSFIARFIDEARIVSALSHSNIVQVFDFGQVDGEYYLAMELVDGPDLGTLLEGCRRCSQPVPIPAAMYIAARIARGLGAAHARRDSQGAPAPVVHRDISPQNVLLSRDGEVKVVDFGIAIAAERAYRTRTGVVVGKCRYMAPEQARGEPVDARADIFALGALLYEVLAGAPLFDGAVPAEVIGKLLAAPIPPLRTQLNPEVPAELEEILLRALARPREGRPENGNALARELESLLHRIAPEYSRDDLAALVRVAAPHRPAPRWEAAATQPDAELAAPQLDGIRDTEPSAARPEPAAGETGETAPAIPSVAIDLAPTAPTPIPVEPASSEAAERSSTRLGPLPEAIPRDRRRSTLVVLAASLCGLLLGGGGRLLARPSGELVRISLRLGEPLERDSWRLTVERVERRADATVVLARVAPEAPAIALLAPRGPLAPRFWSSAPGGSLQLVFEAIPARQPLVLRLLSPAGPAIELALQEAR